jgi:23S rRNA (cytosine1962-C5)-methyltransferase
MDTAQLKDKEERRLLRGHLWAYRNEFQSLPPLRDGAVVDVVAANGRFVGRGFYQAEGGIAVRLLTRKPEDIAPDMLVHRIRTAQRFRERIYPGSTVYRWVYGESDRLPGLVADRYGSVVSVQSSCAFYGDKLEPLAEGFLGAEGVSGVRFEIAGTVETRGEAPERVEAELDGMTLGVHLGRGQKTGMFLDQRENWQAMRAYAPGARVLDGFCYIGAWSVQAAQAGAASVLGVDTSARAIEAARENARRNELEQACAFEEADVGEVLRRGERYDLVLLDPPALAKSRTQTEKALGLYQALNRDAMQALEHGGYLITSSCSHFVSLADFMEMLKRAARAAQRDVWVLEVRGAARDHPILLGMPETAYLKNVVLRVF